MAFKLLFPVVESGDMGRAGTLHSDQKDITKAVVVKLGHCAQVILVFTALEHFGNARLQFIGDSL